MKKIYVTSPSMPQLSEFIPYLESIWDKKILTNGGPFHQELELALCDYLGVEHISLFSNGTLALVTALQALNVTGEVITTPYSFVATAHSLLWNGVKPVFVDVDKYTFNLDPTKIEEAITPNTTAILPVHCYGNQCDVIAIQKIADKYNLKVIYDAAHAFGVKDSQGSILRHGDLSVLSFHATKVFNTFEGGAIVSPNIETKKHIDYLKNFGFVDETTVIATGINGKMSEINAAFGLLQLKSVNDSISKRAKIDSYYRNTLRDIVGLDIPSVSSRQHHNFSYFPILINEDFPITRDQLYERLKEKEIYARRYFYPLISDFPMYSDLKSSNPTNLSSARQIADSVLCLPIFPDLDDDSQKRVASVIIECSSKIC